MLKITPANLARAILIGLVLLPGLALAQQSERFGPYELHYSVVNTTFLDPSVAEAYGITRGKTRGMVNISLREHLDGGRSAAKGMTLKGHIRDLLQRREPLEFREIREGDAIYYIAEFPFIDQEWNYFDIEFTPESGDQPYSYTFKHQLYRD